MRLGLLILLWSATFAGCHLAVDIQPCKRGETCPAGTSCNEALGVCEGDKPTDADAGPGDEGEGEPGGEGEGEPGEGEGEPGEGEGEGEGEPGGEGEGEPGDNLVCGDGVDAAEEACDDGNNLSGDGCSSTCHLDVQTLEVEPNTFPNGGGVTEWDPATGSVVFRGGARGIPADDEADGWILDVRQVTTVRLETFDREDADDCNGSVPFFLSLHDHTLIEQFPTVTTQEQFNTLRDSSYVRGAVQNAGGNGICANMTIRLAPAKYWVVTGPIDPALSIPSYRLQFSSYADLGAEQEPNNTPGEAEDAMLRGDDVEMSGTLGSTADVDVYVVRLPPGRGVRAEVVPTGANTECDNFPIVLRVKNASGGDLVAQAGGALACPFIDGTGAQPWHSQARNTSQADVVTYIAVTAGAGATANLAYRMTFTVR